MESFICGLYLLAGIFFPSAMRYFLKQMFPADKVYKNYMIWLRMIGVAMLMAVTVDHSVGTLTAYFYTSVGAMIGEGLYL